MVKDITLYRFPKVLVIHLKRFSGGHYGFKLRNGIDIPLDLNMEQYAPFSEHESKYSGSKYTLYGISHHYGSLNDGHYVA